MSKKKLLQINVVANSGSTGRIAEDIGKLAIKKGWESWIAYGRGKPQSESNLIRIGDDLDMYLHGLESRLFDNHGLASKTITRDFLKKIIEISPDVIHLHNIHGYYLNYPILFDFFKKYKGRIIWTLHDCWSYTGHCAYYSYAKCNKWKNGCFNCPQHNQYPASWIIDNSKNNYLLKKKYFSNIPNLSIVTVSKWLESEVKQSFLKNYPIYTIYNGVDQEVFYPKQNNYLNKKSPEKIILGVANVWDRRKGLDDLIKLHQLLPDNFKIILVGLSQKQISQLPQGMIGIRRTDNIEQLAHLYSIADIYINTSVEETLGMTTIEAMSCGTPCIVYNTTACPEVIPENICRTVSQNNLMGLKDAIESVLEIPKDKIIPLLQEWVNKNFNKTSNYCKYFELYDA